MVSNLAGLLWRGREPAILIFKKGIMVLAVPTLSYTNAADFECMKYLFAFCNVSLDFDILFAHSHCLYLTVFQSSPYFHMSPDKQQG